MSQPTKQTQSSTALPPPSAADSQTASRNVFVIRLLLTAVAGVIGWLAYTVATGRYYTPRSTLGFYLGVSGSLTMLAMLTYPLRKRARFMQRWGPLRHWFRWHMIMGIVGPTMVLFHSTFHLRSLNATVALTSMLIVVTSGIIGRFIYSLRVVRPSRNVGNTPPVSFRRIRAYQSSLPSCSSHKGMSGIVRAGIRSFLSIIPALGGVYRAWPSNDGSAPLAALGSCARRRLCITAMNFPVNLRKPSR